MKFQHRLLAILGLLFILFPTYSTAQSVFDDIRFSGQFFGAFEYTETDGEKFNQFALERGYITFRKNVSDRIGMRFTQDVTIDEEGDGEGDIELRLKYALVNFNMDDYGLFYSPMAEFGVVRRPWVDFEQTINDYRMQGSMFLDREKIAPSADYGMTFSAMLGPQLENARELNLSRSSAGKYGSFAFGIYNGGGYSQLEKHSNKVIEGRLTLRPFWNILPGFQLTYAGAYGKGNHPDGPNFDMHVGYASFSSRWIVLSAQAYTGHGDSAGRRMTINKDGLAMNGFSGFTEIMPFKVPLRLVGRYDVLNDKQSNSMLLQRGLLGLAWRFPNGSKIMLDFERDEFYLSNGQTTISNIFEIASEIRF